MAAVKKDKKTETGAEGNADSFWRKPISLDPFEDDDPLESLYRGREAADPENTAEKTTRTITKKTAEAPAQKVENSEKSETSAPKPGRPAGKQTPPKSKIASGAGALKTAAAYSPKVSEEALKNMLKIKSDSFQFTDIREILRGKSYDIYAYLRFLAGDAGVCKIKHLDLMKELDISRPTLFKQGDWLTRLSLIEKRSVPGDHLGTSYTVYRLEDVLPVSETLIRQIQSEIENFASKAV